MSGYPFLCQFKVDIWRGSYRQFDLNDFLIEKLKAFSSRDGVSNKGVLIFTRRSDIEMNQLAEELVKKDIAYARINLDDLPNQLLINYRIRNNRNPNLRVKVGSKDIDVSGISLVFLRAFELETRKLGRNRFLHTFSQQQWNDAIQSLKIKLRCKWIPGDPSSISYFQDDRITQLDNASKVGFQVPDTLITNDPGEARNFYGVHKGGIIVKVLHHHEIELGNSKAYSMYTHAVRKKDLRRFDDILYAPSIFQERLQKKSELRVTIVGNRMFAVRVEPRSKGDTKVDWHQSSLKNIKVTPIELEKNIRRKCTKFMTSMRSVFGAIDFVIDKKGQLVFLELNSSPSWLWIERKTYFKITSALSDLIESMINA